MKEKINQAVVDRALEKANTGKAPNLYSWFTTNATKKAQEDFKRFQIQNNDGLLKLLLNNSTDSQIINQNTIYLKHNRKHIFVFVNRAKDYYAVVEVEFDNDTDKIFEILRKYDFGIEQDGDTITLKKYSGLRDIDCSTELSRKNFKEEIKDLAHAFNVINEISYRKDILGPHLLDTIRELLEVQQDYLEADQEINKNTDSEDLNAINYCVDIANGQLDQSNIDEVYSASDLTAKSEAVYKYTDTDRDIEELASDVEAFIGKREREYLQRMVNSYNLTDFAENYTELLEFEDVAGTLSDYAQEMLQADEDGIDY